MYFMLKKRKVNKEKPTFLLTLSHLSISCEKEERRKKRMRKEKRNLASNRFSWQHRTKHEGNRRRKRNRNREMGEKKKKERKKIAIFQIKIIPQRPLESFTTLHPFLLLLLLLFLVLLLLSSFFFFRPFFFLSF